jgi:dienelactone hydrolase
MMDNPKTRAALDDVAFVERHSKTVRFPEILECATALKNKYEKVGAIGFCYGGWAVFQLAARGQNLLHCVSTAHPSFSDEQGIFSLGVPTQILAPEHDHHLTPELKNYYNRGIPENNLPYEYVYFPKVSHGFTTRYDKSDKDQKASLRERRDQLSTGSIFGYIEDVGDHNATSRCGFENFFYFSYHSLQICRRII